LCILGDITCAANLKGRARDEARKLGNEFVKEEKADGSGTGSRSGQHGTPFKRAGQRLIELAKTTSNPRMKEALRQEGKRLIKKGGGFNHQ
jgi:hypothetical protein